MPKTKTVYSKYKAVRLSDKGNQMLYNLCQLSKSDSEASFIRDAIVFYMNNAMNPKIAEFWNEQNVPEINDFGKSNKYVEVQQAKKDTLDYMQKRITNGIKFGKISAEEKKKIDNIFKNKKK